MGQWLYHIDLAEDWKKAEDGLLEPYELAHLAAAKLDVLHKAHGKGFCFKKNDLWELIQDLLALDENTSIKEFDYVWADIYDWADGVRCWIAIF